MTGIARARKWLQRRGIPAVRNAGGGGAAHSAADARDYYDRMTGAYLEGFGPVFQGSRPDSTDELLAYLSDSLEVAPGMRLLDAGCGVGGPAIWLAQNHDIEVEALTLSPVQAEIAGRLAADAGVTERLRVREGDFHRLQELYPANSFDRVIFLESLCHAEEYRQVLAGARELLKPGGALYIKDFHALDWSRDAHRQQASERDLQALNTLYRMTLPRLGDLVSLLGELGFLIRFMRMPTYQSTYTHWAAYERVADRYWAPSSGQPGEVIQAVEFFCWKV